jgi:cyclophilin family peptidyl-prolyl cis-trans isomerase
LRFEPLEDRSLLSVSVGAGAPVLVAFDDSTAAAGTAFTASSTNPDVTATVLQTSELVKMTVHTVNSDGTSGPEGEMDFLLLSSVAPNNIQHITSLINSGFYNGQDFFRIIQNFMIQGGDPTGTGNGNSGTPGNPAQIQDDEFSTDIRFTSPGLLALAKPSNSNQTGSQPDANDCQFFITTDTYRDGDFQYTIIGKLVAGNDMLQSLNNVPVQVNSSSGEDSQPVNPPIIDTVTVGPDTQYGLVLLKASGTATAGETANVTVAGSDGSVATLTDSDGSTQQASLVVDVTAADVPSTADRPAFIEPMPDVSTTMNTPITVPIPVGEGDAGVPLSYGAGGASDSTNLQVSASGTGATDGSVTATPSGNIVGLYSFGVGVGRNSTDPSADTSYDVQFVALFIHPDAPATLSVTTAGVQNGGTTNVNSNLAFHVTGLTNGLTVAIFVDGGATPIGTATAANGVADVPTTEQLSDGLHTFTAEQSFAYTSTAVGNRTIAAGTLYSTPSTSTVQITVNLTPTPNPITWAVAPYATSATSIEMVATTASAPGGVQYYFHCSAGGGNDSAWQTSPIYEDIGLSPGTTYAYQVKTRSALSVTDVGAYSVSAVAMTPRVNEPPSVLVTTPLATPSGLIPISYTLSDPDSDVCSIQVQYSIDGGANWLPATQGPGGSGTSGLTASPAGTVHTFAWSSFADLGKTDNANVEIQITPSDAKAGTPVATGVFAVDNSGLTTTLTLGPMSTAYLPGQSITLSWLAGNVPANSKIGLEYYNYSTGSYTWIEGNQVSVADGAGSYVWNTSNMPTGSYCVEGEITTWLKPPIAPPGTVGPAMTSVTDVTSAPTSLFAVRPSATTFALTGSATGTFIAGQIVPIHWTAANVTAGSKISLCIDTDTTWNNGTEKWIEIDGVAAANGYGTFNWNTTGLKPGTYYVAGYLWNGVGAFTWSHLTQPITIVAAPQTFALTGPTSGTYQAGQTATISWTGVPAAAGSKISLCIDKDTITDNGNETWIEIDHVSANGSGSYTWNTAGVQPGTYYVAGYLWNGNGAFTFSHLTKSITITAPEALMVAAALPPQGSPALLTGAQLTPIVAEAEKRWEAELGTQATAALAGITIGVANLPAGMLGETVGSTIIIDQDAAGYGWFVDPTPGDDAEFTVAAGPYTLAAPQGTAAASRADLLTTVMHEMGHVLGYQDDTAGDLMNATLPLGARRTAVDAALATL